MIRIIVEGKSVAELMQSLAELALLGKAPSLQALKPVITDCIPEAESSEEISTPTQDATVEVKKGKRGRPARSAGSPSPTPASPVDAIAQVEKEAAPPAEIPQAADVPAGASIQYTFDQVKQRLQEIVTQKDYNVAKQVLKEFNVQKVSALDATDYAAFMELSKSVLNQ